MEIRGNTLIDILKWNIYAPIIYLRADKVDQFQWHVCIYL